MVSDHECCRVESRSRRETRGWFRRTDRAVTPVTGKLFEIGIVVLFVAMLSATLYGGVLPEYRTATAVELGDRTLATASNGIETSVPVVDSGTDRTTVHRVAVETRIDLPATIRGQPYRIRTDGQSILLDHPHHAVGGRREPAMPAPVTTIDGEWRSGGTLLVIARQTDDGVTLELVTR